MSGANNVKMQDPSAATAAQNFTSVIMRLAARLRRIPAEFVKFTVQPNIFHHHHHHHLFIA